MQNKLTKDEVLNHFNILYDDLPKSIQLQLDKFFPIQYNELNSEQYNEYYELCLKMLNKKLEVDMTDMSNLKVDKIVDLTKIEGPL